MIVILRLGHRRERDKRATTHVGLAARALGASGIILCGEKDEKVEESLVNVTLKWGGKFDVSYCREWKGVLREWKERGVIVHLTMYGEPIQKKMEQIRKEGKDILVVVGSEKVPPAVYGLADYNVAVSSQPHSEVAALAIFLDRFFEGQELEMDFGGEVRILPSKRGKSVISCRK